MKVKKKQKQTENLTKNLPKENALFNLKLIVSTGFFVYTTIYPLIFKQKAGAIYTI